MKIKIIASNPQEDQLDIESLIGKEFEAKFLSEDGSVAISSFEFDGDDGLIRLNKNEYTRVE